MLYEVITLVVNSKSGFSTVSLGFLFYLLFRKGSRNENQTQSCILSDFDFPARLSIYHSYAYHINRIINSMLALNEALRNGYDERNNFV